MAKLSLAVGSTGKILQVFIQDSSKTDGSGLTGLTNATSGLTAYYHRDTDTTATAISLVTMTVGTFTSSGFKEIDSTNMPGWYQLCPPNAALASGAKSVGIHLRGAANMAPLPLEIELTATDNQDAVRGGLTALPNANAEASGGLYTRGSGAGQINQPANGQIDANTVKVSGTAQTARDLGASVLIASGTGTGQLDVTSGVIKSNLSQILGTALTETSGQIAAAFKKFFNIATPASTMDHLTLVDTATTLTNAPSDSSGVTTLLSRVPSGIFTGITSLAQWLGLLAGKQTGNSTARTEVRATGAGSGTFDETTDSQEALRDRGDAAWITATGFSTLDAAGVRTAVGLASANLDAQLTAIDADVQASAQPGDAMTLTAAYDAAKTAAQASVLGTPAGVSVSADVAALKTEADAIKAKTDNLPASPAAVSDIPTAAANADKFLGRSLATGADGGRTVQDALRTLRNKVTIDNANITVCAEDDTTTAWSGTVTRASADALQTVDPA